MLPVLPGFKLRLLFCFVRACATMPQISLLPVPICADRQAACWDQLRNILRNQRSGERRFSWRGSGSGARVVRRGCSVNGRLRRRKDGRCSQDWRGMSHSSQWNQCMQKKSLTAAHLEIEASWCRRFAPAHHRHGDREVSVAWRWVLRRFLSRTSARPADTRRVLTPHSNSLLRTN
jgi:hypothetical protein